MAAVGIVGLAIGSAANLRTVLLSVRQRYEHFSVNEEEFDELVNSLVRVTENLRECERKLSNGRRDEDSGILIRNLTSVNQRLVACGNVLDKLAEGPLQVHSRRSCLHIACKCREITNANRIHGKLNKVAGILRHSDVLVGQVANLLVNSERSPEQASGQRVGRRLGMCSVPSLTDHELLDFDGQDENGEPTPEAQLKSYVLGKHSKKVTAAAGNASGRRHASGRRRASVHSAHGMAGVGKTVALRGLGWDKDVREAFDEIHYITLGHDATADTVVSELGRIVDMSGGENESSMILKCKDVKEAVTLTSKWFFRRKCLFLADDVWKTTHNTYGYLPLFRELLSGCEGSRMVITTRDNNIASEVGQSVQFGSRGSVTSRQMFLGYFGNDMSDASSLERSSEESVEKILGMCSGLPLALSIAGRGARALKDEGRSAGHAVGEYASRFAQHRSKLVEEPLPGYGGDDESLNLRAAIETSLNFLDSRNIMTGTSGGMRIGEMYRALGVLKAQAWAPVCMLSKLWNVGREEAESIMGQLCTMSLAKREDLTCKAIRSGEERSEGGLRIHDLQLAYCQLNCKDIKGRHGNLLNGYLEATVLQRTQGSVNEDEIGHEVEDAMLDVEPRPWWSASVAEDGYVHENVAWHLVKAGKRDELRGLLVDARWIKLRLVVGGIVSLENDFAELVRMDDSVDVEDEGSGIEWSESEFRSILNALRCSWNYILQNERELAVQVGGRLFEVQETNTAARKLVESAIKNSERPFAEARYGSLSDARSGQVNEVDLGALSKSLSYSSCGKYIAAAAGKDVVVVESDTLYEKMRFKGHTADVNSVCYLPESCKIVSGSEDCTVRLWDMEKPGDDPITLGIRRSRVTSVCVNADGSRAASGCRDGTVRLWNLEKESRQGEEMGRRAKWMSCLCCSATYSRKTLRGHTYEVNGVCFSPDGSLLASASDDGTVRLWNAHTGKHTGITFGGHGRLVVCVAFSPDGKRVASGSADGTIRLWRADTGAPADIVIEGHSDWVNSVAFSADGARIVSASSDKTVRVWSAESGAAMSAALTGHTGTVGSAVFSPNDARVVSVSYDGTLRVWEPEIADGVSAADEVHSSFARCVAFSADGTRVAVGYSDGAICIWDTQSGEAVGRPLKGHTDWVQCLAFSSDGTLLASGSDDKTVRLWDTQSGKAVGRPLKGHTDWVRCIAFSSDGTLLASGSDDKTVRLWETQSRKAVGRPLKGHTDWVRCIAFSPDGALLASGSDDKTVRLWNVRTGAAVGGALEGHKHFVDKVLLSADGSKLLSYSFLGAHRCLWSVPSGTLLWMSHRSTKDVANALSDVEANVTVEAIERQSRGDASNEAGVVYYDEEDGAVKMKHNEGDVRLASLPPLLECGKSWMHSADRIGFTAVLRGGRPMRLTIHV